MIVEVETPDGVVSGSAVREFVFQGQPKASLPSIIPAEGSSGYSFLRGEAVYVDLGEGRSLIALLSGAEGNADYTKQIPREILECRGAKMETCLDSANIYPEEAEITFEKRFPFGLPLLVTFGDLTDPTSVARVDPDDLVSSFGEGYALKRITVQITDEPLTTDVSKRLKKLGVEPNQSLDNDFVMTTDPTLAQLLGYSDFARGNLK